MSQNLRRTIVIEGVRYHDDRPKSCERCFFWKNKRTGCILGKENCYYLAHVPEKPSKCDNCPYAKGGPCVTVSCYKDLEAWLRERRR